MAFIRLLFLLILAVLGPIRAYGAELPQKPFLFVLDMDRLFIDEKSHLYDDVEPNETITVGAEHYRLAPYAPEFLAALYFYFPRVLKVPVKMAIFSGGSHARNLSVVEQLRLSQRLQFKDMIAEVKSFEDLTLVKDLPREVDRTHALEYVRAKGGQDKFPFFEVFKKDLRAFGFDLDRVVIFEDNMNATPFEQIQNVLGVARPDIFEQLINNNTLGSRIHWVPDGAVVPLQHARARYRLVRAMGILATAAEMHDKIAGKTIPELLFALQWKQDNGAYRQNFLNSRAIYQKGMAVLETVYELYLKRNGPQLKRTPDYFHFDSAPPKSNDCNSITETRVGVFPWGEL